MLLINGTSQSAGKDSLASVRKVPPMLLITGTYQSAGKALAASLKKVLAIQAPGMSETLRTYTVRNYVAKG